MRANGGVPRAGGYIQLHCRTPSRCGPLPYPMRLGRKPIAIATTASTVTTRMAAASISTNFSVAQSPDGWCPCQVCTSLQRQLHHDRVADAWPNPAAAPAPRKWPAGPHLPAFRS